MFIHNNIKNIQNIQNIKTLFEILPTEIILGILFHVFRDNDDDIRSAIPYLIPFLIGVASKVRGCGSTVSRPDGAFSLLY